MFREFFSKRFFIGVLVLVICCVVSVYFLNTDTSEAPIKIYKSVEPVAKPTAEVPVGDTSRGGHFHPNGTWHAEPHESVSHTYTKESTKNRTADDWREDSEVDVPQPAATPWKKLDAQEANIGTPVSSDADSTYPPRDWHKTEDPELRAEYFYAQLLKQFGDLPEVHIIGEHRLNRAKGIPSTLSKYEAYLEAMYSLFPHEKNKKTLDQLRELRASGAKISFN